MRGKKEKGITLIALIITIIVMLILVTVTVTSAINVGIFKKAGEAVNKTKDSMKNEQNAVNKLLAEMEKYQSGEKEPEKEKPTAVANAERDYIDEKHKITITATGTAEEGGKLNYNLKFYKGEHEEEKTETQEGISGEEVTFTFDELEKDTTYTYEIEVKDENELMGNCEGTCTTYCVGEYCAGASIVDCDTCGGDGMMPCPGGTYTYDCAISPWGSYTEYCVDCRRNWALYIGYYLKCETCGGCRIERDLSGDFDMSNRVALFCGSCLKTRSESDANLGKPTEMTGHNDITCNAEDCVEGKITKTECDHGYATEHYHCDTHGDSIEKLH